MTDLELVNPHAATLVAACSSTGVDPYILAGIGLRESRFGAGAGYEPKGDPCGWGDRGNGWGYFQIDKRWHAPFLSSPASRTVAGQAEYAARLLAANGRYLTPLLANRLDEYALRVAIIASYNCGPGNVYRAVAQGQSPEARTTGGDYATWVIDRAEGLRSANPRLMVSA